MPAGIHIKNLNYAYTPEKPVLRDISLDIQPGERFGIIGPSGAGKSTLLLHLNGILSGTGTVRIGDTDVTEKNIARIREKVGIVFQNPDDQLFSPTVGEDVAFGPLNFGLSRAETAERVRTALEVMDLTGYEDRAPFHLSLGERKRVALATVLAMRPEVIAFDEPFSNLHPAMVSRLIDTIAPLEATVVIISQSILPVLACCSRIAVLNKGEIAQAGPAFGIARNRELMDSCGLDISLYCSVCKMLAAGESSSSAER